MMTIIMVLLCGSERKDPVNAVLKATEIKEVVNLEADIVKVETTTSTATTSNTETKITTNTTTTREQTSTSMPMMTTATSTTLTEAQTTSCNVINEDYVSAITTDYVQQSVNTDTSNIAKDMIKNGLFYCRYTVKQNDGWDSLYTNYWVTKEQICAFNGINPNEYLQAGWIIYIPLDTYVPPSVWNYDYQPVYDVNYGQATGNSSGTDYTPNSSSSTGVSNDDGLVWSNSVTLWTTNSEWGSWYNIKLSASMLNGMKIGPGESFSWFTNMGPCQYDQGFVDGGAYVEGGSAPGGGICFTSTGLMQGARGAGCVITEKYDHIYPVSYASPGDEASVSWGYLDLKFYNPSATTGLQFWVTADEYSQSLTVTVSPYYPYG